MVNSLVSIIIPTYNRAHLIGETLDSIKDQTYSNWECLVIDDGSKDHTKELMEFYCSQDFRIQFHIRPKNHPKGANACRNYGFELSKGEFVNWFDSDDIMHARKLELQLLALDDEKYNFTVCQTLVFEKKIDNIIGLRHERIQSKKTFNDYIKGNIIWLTQAPLWRKVFLLKNNYSFNELLDAAQEWEYHSRILNKHPEYHIIEMPLVYIRKHNDSISYNSNLNNRKWHYFMARNLIYINQSLTIDLSTEKYLQSYLLKEWKQMVLDRNSWNSIKAFKSFLLFEKKISIIKRIFGLLSIISYSLFNRGHVLLNKVSYPKKNNN